jgi:methionyl-tRNA formyltransferase
VRLGFLTADDPVYLPSFFELVLAEYHASTDGVFLVPPLYKGQTTTQAAWRYYRTFGAGAVAGLAKRIAAVKTARRSIARTCERFGVAHEVVTDVNSPEFVARLAQLGLDVIVSVSCPQIFKQPLLDVPAIGCLNIHGAMLPQYRGVMPSFWMLANGERQAGVTIYFMDEEIDAGEICAQRQFEILPTETLDQFLRRSKRVAAELLIDVLPSIERGTAAREPVDTTRGSYYSWPDKEAVRRFRAAGRRLW